MSRYQSMNHAISTPFGKFYLHISYDLETGRPVGGWLSDPLKDKATTITEFAEAIGKGFDSALKQLAQEYAFLIEIEDEDTPERLR